MSTTHILTNSNYFRQGAAKSENDLSSDAKPGTLYPGFVRMIFVS